MSQLLEVSGVSVTVTFVQCSPGTGIRSPLAARSSTASTHASPSSGRTRCVMRVEAS